MKLEIKLPRVKCSNCGHEWTPRKPNPIWCPKCMHPDIVIIKNKE